MAARRVIEGKCHICGVIGPLSYEHVPPRAAFNDLRTIEADAQKIIDNDSIEYVYNRKGKTNQRGAGGYTLCRECNSFTGINYVPSYVHFAHCVHDIAFSLPVFKSCFVGLRIKPLNVLKQILAMFCSCNGERFAEANPGLKEYILEPLNRIIPSNIHVSIALQNPVESVVVRSSGIISSMDLDTNKICIFSEIAFHPFVLMIDLNKNRASSILTNIDWFANYDYNEERDINIIMKSLPVSTPIGGVYLTENQLRELYASS